MSTAGWTVVVPVKPLPAAKRRLRGAVPDPAHAGLVLAMARDTVAAALACPEIAGVVVVSDDPLVRAGLTALGAHCLPDRPAGGLNAALAFGAGTVAGPVAALTADLPALRPAELSAALTAAAGSTPGTAGSPPGTAGPTPGTAGATPGTALAGSAFGTAAPGTAAMAGRGGRAFVADAAGTGTVLLTALGSGLAPHFGPDSAAAHRASGASELSGDWPSLRRDVDTAADLWAARTLGLGPATAAYLATTTPA